MTLPPHKRILQHFDISEQGLRELEIWLEKNQEPNWGPWVYVGTAPTDQNITHLSPPFQNGWRNSGGGLQRLRFRRTMPTNLKKKQSLEIEGVIEKAASTTDSVVFTLPKGYRPREASGPVVAANTANEVVIWNVATTGAVTYVDAAAGTGTSAVGTELDYAESSVDHTVVSTNPAIPDSLLTGSAITLDGTTRIKVEFWCGQADVDDSGGASTYPVVSLWDGASHVANLLSYGNEVGYVMAPVSGAVFLTPTAGSHTYAVNVNKDGAGAATLYGTVAGVFSPYWYRVTRA